MPQVPYSGAPTVAPQLDPTPRYTADVTPDMFGANIGRAVQQLGQTSEQVGNEIFARGLAMQDLANHSEAEAATAKFMERTGDIYAKLDSMQGKDAVDYYAKGFKDDLNKAHEEIGGTLSNPMSQKLFNSEALSTIGRTMMNGARVAGAANKQYAIDTIESRIKARSDTAAAATNPEDVAAAKADVVKLSTQRGALKGQDPDSVAEYAKVINSSTDYNYIKHLAQKKPYQAEEEFKARRAGMTKEDQDRAETVITNTKRSVESVNIAQEIVKSHVGDDGKPDVSYEEMEKEAEDKAKAMAPDDALMVKHTIDALHGIYKQKIYADKQFKWENSQTVDAAIQNGVKDIQELRASDPKVAAAIDALPKSEQLKLPARINAYNAARDKVMNLESLTRISGLRNNDQESFLNLDATDPSLKLNQSQIIQVQNWQREDTKHQNSDPRVNRAMDWLRQARGGELSALGVYSRHDGKNNNEYDHLTGTLQSALEAWKDSKGKPPTYDEVVNIIGPQIIKSRAVSNSILPNSWGQSNEPFYIPDRRSEDYKNKTAKMIVDVTSRGEPEPTEDELDRAYNRIKLMELYPPKAKPSGK